MTGAAAERTAFLDGVRAVAGRRRGGSAIDVIARGLDHLQHGTALEQAQYRGVVAAVCHLDGKTVSAAVWCRREEVDRIEFLKALHVGKVTDGSA
jgi:hypothetical protein